MLTLISDHRNNWISLWSYLLEGAVLSLPRCSSSHVSWPAANGNSKTTAYSTIFIFSVYLKEQKCTGMIFKSSLFLLAIIAILSVTSEQTILFFLKLSLITLFWNLDDATVDFYSVGTFGQSLILPLLNILSEHYRKAIFILSSFTHNVVITFSLKLEKDA